MDMNYELAKQLKEAGFPQTGQGWMFIEIEGQDLPDEVWNADAAWSGIYSVNIKAPTLEELIEACGGELHCLVHTIDEGKDFWSAGKDNIAQNWHNALTPNEAVARLYIALKKNG